MSGIPTVDEVIALLASIGVTPPPDADPDLALAAAISAAGAATGRTYGRVTETRLTSGTCMSVLPIDPCRQITAVSVSADWLSSPDPTFTVVDPALWRAQPADQEQKVFLQRYDGALWTNGINNIRIAATWGADMPADLYQAVLWDAAGSLYVAAVQSGGGTIKRYTEGDIGVEYADTMALLTAGSARFAHAYAANVNVTF